ncbi:MAG: TIGR00268 family protein, partial [Candidatus Omnitrophota bacterium]
CFFCKQELFLKLKNISGKLGLKCILDGTNKDDTKDVRPGQRANAQFNVISPLRDAGLNKKEIRALCKKLGIDYLKPQGACLASRIPFGEKITKKNIIRVRKAEELLKSFFGDGVLLRARDHKAILRIEIGNKDWTKLKKSDINSLIRKLKNIGYKYITLDLEGYIPAGLRA